MIPAIVDANIFLRTVDRSSAQHAIVNKAVHHLGSTGYDLFSFEQTSYEYWTAATRPIANNGLGLLPAQCERELVILLGTFPLLEDNPGLFAEWRKLVNAHSISGKPEHDARYVAAMNTCGLAHILTFNVSDFARVPGIVPLDPVAIAASRRSFPMRILLALPLFVSSLGAAEPGVTVNEERLKRIKAATMPKIEKPVSFDTPEADAILAALEVFPPDNPWNIPVDAWPVHPRSKEIVATVGNDKPLRYNPDMAFVLVLPDQKAIDVKMVSYPDESDKGPFPVPGIVPIEGWPAHYRRNPKLKDATPDEVQRDTRKENGDRHAIVVDPVNRKLYEFYQLKKVGDGWQAACEATFDLASNKMRPAGWTSSDAAGLPIFPSIVRYDELERGKIEHALRVTIRRTQKAYVYPATHHASRLTDKDLPRMGERFRLRKDFDTSKFTKEAKTILEALKTYGMINADNGIEWAISVAPDERIPVLNDELRKLKGSDFEVVTAPPGYKPAK